MSTTQVFMWVDFKVEGNALQVMKYSAFQQFKELIQESLC